MSRGAYAGQPLTFRCAKCRSTLVAHLLGRGLNVAGLRFRLTGRTCKLKSRGVNHHHWGDVAYEYVCLDCKHIGWSRHPDVARRYELDQEAKA
jgi:hypothetical protein